MSTAEEIGNAGAAAQLMQQLQQQGAELAVKGKALNAIHMKNGNLELELAANQLELERVGNINAQLVAEIKSLKGEAPAPLRAVESPAEPEAPVAEPAQS